jgi:hypothetical protein
VIADRREGINVFYRLVDPRVEHLLEEALGPAGQPSRPAQCPCPKCNPCQEDTPRD